MPRPFGSKENTQQILDLVMEKHSQGEKIKKIARHLNRNYWTVRRIILRNGKRIQRSGRPRKIDPRLARRMFWSVRKNPRIYASELREEFHVDAHIKTIKRVLVRFGLQSRIARKKPNLKRQHKLARLKFALKHINKPLSFWRRIMWTDESKICSFKLPRRRVWRFPGESLKDKFTNGTAKGQSTSVMVWGSCGANGVGTLHHITSRMDRWVYIGVLAVELRPSREKLGLRHRWVFMHDNDPKHTARDTKTWLARKRIKVLGWPANSPDLNPIEHLWDVLKKQMQGSERVRESILFEKVTDAWNKIDPRVVRNLVDSLPRRLKAVIKARGGHTRY